MLLDLSATSRQSFRLRDYQVRALEVIDRDLKASSDPVLLQAIMGAGKTVTVARLINRYWFEAPDRRFIVLAHKQELVEQFERTFREKTDVPPHKIGICCAGLRRRDTRHRLVIGTVQTAVNHDLRADLLVIDEAHRVDINGDTQYRQIIEALRAKQPAMRILGVTATPARLGHGYIYGDRCRPGSVNLFPRLNHLITYDELLRAGYLAPLRGVVAAHKTISDDLARVSTSGDYVLSELGQVMSRERHIHTAAEAVAEYCQDRRHVCVFACTIDHAEKLAEAIPGATVVHSKLSPIERKANMQSWTSGRRRVMVSVNILVEGFDFPALDCLVMARPTLSSTLWLQAVGRVLRTAPGKDDGLLVDLTDNTARFGTDLDNIKVTVPRAVQSKIEREDAMWKLCPKCEREVHVARRVCDCGYEWPAAECDIAETLPEMQRVEFTRLDPEWIEPRDMKVMVHESRKTGKLLGRVMFSYGENIYHPDTVSLFFCLPDHYDGYAVEKSRERWQWLSNDPFPETVAEFINAEIVMPYRILVDTAKDYPEIIDVEETPF